jgi:hypothetical protein
LDGVRSMLKDILHKARGLAQPRVPPEPPSKSILKASSEAVGISTPVQSVTRQRTPRISFAIPPSNSPLRRSPRSPSLLPQYDADRADASRSAVPPPVTSTPSSDLRRAALLRSASQQRATTDTNSPRRGVTSTHPPGWLPSGKVLMSSRTTRQTYSTDPSFLFTASLPPDNISPMTTAVVTPSPAPKTAQASESSVAVVKDPVAIGVESSSQEGTDQRNIITAEAIVDPLARQADGREIWIKVAASSPYIAASATTRKMDPPSITIRPPTPATSQAVISPMIPDAMIVESPEGSVISSRDSAHTSDSYRATAASDPVQSLDGHVSHGGSSDNVQSSYHTAETDNLATTVATPVDGIGMVDVLQTAEASDTESQSVYPQELSASDSSRTAQVHPPNGPRLLRSVASSSTQPSGQRPGSVETQGVPVMAQPDPDPVIPDADSTLQDNSPSTPISQLNLVQPPPVKPLQAASFNYIMAPSVDQVRSSVGPNAPEHLFETDTFPPNDLIPYYPGYPRYPALSLSEFLPFRRPELRLPLPAHLSADGNTWVTSGYVEILTNDFMPWSSSEPDHRLRRYTTLGLVSKSAGKFNYLVYNRKSGNAPHTLTLASPGAMDSVQLRCHTNHLSFLLYLKQLPVSSLNVAVWYDEAPAVWYCPEEFICYLSVRYSAGRCLRALIVHYGSLMSVGLLIYGMARWRNFKCL